MGYLWLKLEQGVATANVRLGNDQQLEVWLGERNRERAAQDCEDQMLGGSCT